MTTITIKAAGRSLTARASGPLTAGMVGVPYEVEADEAWKELSRTVVFQAGSTTRSAADGLVPGEVLAEPLEVLRVGLVGRRADGTVVIPTVWAELGTISPAARESGLRSPKPENPVWARSAALTRQAAERVAALEQTLQNRPEGVRSVNGRKGAVTLTAAGVAASEEPGKTVQALLEELNRLGRGDFRLLETIRYYGPTVLYRTGLSLKAMLIMVESTTADFSFDMDLFQTGGSLYNSFEVRPGCSGYSLFFGLLGKPVQLVSEPTDSPCLPVAVQAADGQTFREVTAGTITGLQTRIRVPSGCEISIFGVEA